MPRVADQYNEGSPAEVWDERGPEATWAEQLRRWRSVRGWSQQDVADRMSTNFGYGWHQTTVARIEGRLRPIRLNEAAALAIIFGVDLAEVLQPPALTPAEIETLSRREARLLAHSRELELERESILDELTVLHQRMDAVDQARHQVEMQLEHVRGRVAGTSAVLGGGDVSRSSGVVRG
ncbi:hypothetical protein Vwe01_27650 [Micromonospora andamanensis]|nr:hypothetical protein Vwe01_27650 [Micromonospora andamanensis]